MPWWTIFSQTQGIMAAVGNFNFSYFFRLTWEFLGFESEREDSVLWPNNKIIDKEINRSLYPSSAYMEPRDT